MNWFQMEDGPVMNVSVIVTFICLALATAPPVILLAEIAPTLG